MDRSGHLQQILQTPLLLTRGPTPETVDANATSAASCLDSMLCWELSEKASDDLTGEPIGKAHDDLFGLREAIARLRFQRKGHASRFHGIVMCTVWKL